MDKHLIAQRLKSLREGAKLSQAKLSQELNIKQPLIARYETAINTPPYTALIAYADFFDVSCDYLLGRCEEPQGKLYKYLPKTITYLYGHYFQCSAVSVFIAVIVTERVKPKVFLREFCLVTVYRS